MEFPTKMRWDYAWKDFLNPKMVWFRWFLEKLIGDSYDGWDVEVTSTESHNAGAVMFADRNIKLTLDHRMKIIHLEFQSGDCRDMGKRELLYGLQHATGPSNQGNTELYQLPDSYIVNVKSFTNSGYADRKLVLQLHGIEYTLLYPVVDAVERVPYIKEIMNAKTSEKRGKYAVKMCRLFPDFWSSTEVVETFFTACALIGTKEAYGDGVDSSIIKEEVMGTTKKWITNEESLIAYGEERGLQRGKEQGMSEAIDIVAKSYGISREDAAKLMEGDLSVLDKRGFTPNGKSGAKPIKLS